MLEIVPGDFGGVAISDPCSGLVLYAGSIVWAGGGEQLYPAAPIRSDALKRVSQQISPPRRVDVVIGPYADGDEEGGIAAWNSVKDLNLVQEIASAPYSVLVYLYPRTVGMFNPANADWVILLYRGPTPATPNPNLRPTITPPPVPTSQQLLSPPPTLIPTLTPTPIVMCDNFWTVTAKVWVDANENSLWDIGEQPLQDVEVWAKETPSTHGNRDRLTWSLSDSSGEAELDLFLAGCPRVTVEIFASVPGGFHVTTQGDPAAVIDGELVKSTFLFGFVSSGRTPQPDP